MTNNINENDLESLAIIRARINTLSKYISDGEFVGDPETTAFAQGQIAGLLTILANSDGTAHSDGVLAGIDDGLRILAGKKVKP